LSRFSRASIAPCSASSISYQPTEGFDGNE
jgi:hypothetical protein